MKIQQISIFAENKPGHLSAPMRLLAQEGVDIRALYLADTQEYGIVRMIVSDWQKAAKALEAHGFVAKVTRVGEKVLQLQASKRALLADVFEASDAASAKLSLTDLKALLTA